MGAVGLDWSYSTHVVYSPGGASPAGSAHVLGPGVPFPCGYSGGGMVLKRELHGDGSAACTAGSSMDLRGGSRGSPAVGTGRKRDISHGYRVFLVPPTQRVQHEL